MKLSISNIAWSANEDNRAYALMKDYGFVGLEIAPTKVFPVAPYDKLPEAEVWARALKSQYGFSISSMQSIWYGRNENIFGSHAERSLLLEYTKRAIDFAECIGCRNLVFGCPRNRQLHAGAEKSAAVDFFKKIGKYAFDHRTVIAMEANPPIYNTNYINNTSEALQLVKEVASEGFKLNLDVGTMVYYAENVNLIKNHVHRISHVHISEPGLRAVEMREFHCELKNMLLAESYKGYISIEMANTGNLEKVRNVMKYVASVFS